MKYTWEFKLECVENYKSGFKNTKPDYAKCSNEDFGKMVRKWVRIFDDHGIDGLKHKQQNKAWTQEERFELVSKVYAGHSILSVACEAGINSGQLYRWVRKYRLNGYDGLKLRRRGRPPKEDNIVPRTNDDVKLTKSEREELKLLKRRNEYLEAENAYLKKVKALAMEKIASSAKVKKRESSKNSSIKKNID